jgi:hypothetical protein
MAEFFWFGKRCCSLNPACLDLWFTLPIPASQGHFSVCLHESVCQIMLKKESDACCKEWHHKTARADHNFITRISAKPATTTITLALVFTTIPLRTLGIILANPTIKRKLLWLPFDWLPKSVIIPTSDVVGGPCKLNDVQSFLCTLYPTMKPKTVAALFIELQLDNSFNVQRLGWPERCICSKSRCMYGIIGREAFTHFTAVYGECVRF